MSMTKTSKALGVLAVFVLASWTAWAGIQDSSGAVSTCPKTDSGVSTVLDSSSADCTTDPASLSATDVGATPADPSACGSAELATLSVVDCAGIEPVASLADALGADPATANADSATAQSQAAPDAASSATTSPVVSGLPRDCRLHLRAVFYAATDWLRLGQKLAADPSPCADYYISIPPLAADKTALRPAQDDLIRALGPRFHAVAEINVTGWRGWVTAHSATWFDAGVEARRRMAAAGYDIASGDTWALNELPSTVRRDEQNARTNMRDFIRGLYTGDGTVPVSKGVVFVIGLAQTLTDTSVYHATLEGWLQDEPFWADMARYVDFWAQEVYPDSRTWGVPGTSREARAEHFNDYLYHPLILAEAAPASVHAARSFLESAYTPLASAAWSWDTGFGNTEITQEQMNNFVSEEVFSIRHYTGGHPQTTPQAAFGSAWAPRNTGLPASLFVSLTAGILERAASSLHFSYDQGGSSQAGACGPPGDHSWCDADVEGASFNDAWKLFATW
jgi:hypothetical protein